MSSKGRISLAIFLVAAFLSGILFSTVGANIFNLGHLVGTESRAEGTRVEVASTAADLEDAFTIVAESVNPTVVQIRSERAVRRQSPFGGGQNPFEGTPFEDFFGGPGGPGGGNDAPQYSSGLGSGVIARADGYIITNNHVIDGADELEVVLFDGSVYDAEVVGTDPGSDLAVVKIDAEGLPQVSYGRSDQVRVGQWVMAFGSPLSQDLGNTVTAGIVSAIGRTSENLMSLNSFAAFIQTDAAINPGNSGGPLVNLRGELVGINSAIFSRSGGNQGIGFAIPISVVENVTTQLIESGAVERGQLGLYPGRVSPTLAEALGVPRGAALVTDVIDGAAADRAGLKSGDIIVAIDGRQLRDYTQIFSTVANKRPGDVVRLEVVDEDGDRRTVEVKLDRRDDTVAENGPRANPNREEGEEAEIDALGLSLRELDAATTQRMGLQGAIEGVLIADLDRASEAFRDAELRPNDIIVEIDRKPVRSMREFRSVYRDVEAGEMFVVRAVRPIQNGQTRTIVTALTKPKG